MTNTILRAEQDPDTGEWVEVYMSDEEWLGAFHPRTPNKQILRDKIAKMKTAKVSKQADLEARINDLESVIKEIGKQK